MSLASGKVWRRRHPEKARAQNRAARDQRRELVAWLRDLPCADCGETFEPCVMEFDHTGTAAKLDTISGMPARRGLLAILREICKTDTICANCHRIRTWKRQQHSGTALASSKARPKTATRRRTRAH